MSRLTVSMCCRPSRGIFNRTGAKLAQVIRREDRLSFNGMRRFAENRTAFDRERPFPPRILPPEPLRNVCRHARWPAHPTHYQQFILCTLPPSSPPRSLTAFSTASSMTCWKVEPGGPPKWRNRPTTNHRTEPARQSSLHSLQPKAGNGCQPGRDGSGKGRKLPISSRRYPGADQRIRCSQELIRLASAGRLPRRWSLRSKY